MATRGLYLLLGPASALGVGRFAYALVLPLMQEAWGLSYAQGGLLGSANTLGYLLGALSSHHLLLRLGYRRGFFLALFLQALALSLTGALGFPLAFALRLLQGFLGALVFVGGAALLMASGGSSPVLGLYYGGVGLGLLLSPLALKEGLSPLSPLEAWGRLGLLAFLLSLPSLLALPALREPPPPARGEGGLGPIGLLLLAYGLYGAGYIGYMTFVAAALGQGGLLFTLLGLGALLTGFVWGPWVEVAGAFPRPSGAFPGQPSAPGQGLPRPQRPPLRAVLPGGHHRYHPGLPRPPAPFRLASSHGAFHRGLRPGPSPRPHGHWPLCRGLGKGRRGALGGLRPPLPGPPSHPGPYPALRPKRSPPTKLAPKGRL